jgi:predicted metal-dependent peptidase
MGPTPRDGSDGERDADANDEDRDRDTSDTLADRPGAAWDAPDPATQEAEWQVAVKQASHVAQMTGQLPAGLRQAVEESLNPQIGWRAVLRRFVQQFAQADYSWRMPTGATSRAASSFPSFVPNRCPPWWWSLIRQDRP